MPRFVLLYHECPPSFSKPSHWDFMLERGDVLLTWELCGLPSAWADPPINNVTSVPAVRLEDHRPAYLDYEGPLTEDRGSVSRYDEGDYQLQHEDGELLLVRLQGKKLQGNVELKRSGDTWQLTARPC